MLKSAITESRSCSTCCILMVTHYSSWGRPVKRARKMKSSRRQIIFLSNLRYPNRKRDLNLLFKRILRFH